MTLKKFHNHFRYAKACTTWINNKLKFVTYCSRVSLPGIILIFLIRNTFQYLIDYDGNLLDFAINPKSKDAIFFLLKVRSSLETSPYFWKLFCTAWF